MCLCSCCGIETKTTISRTKLPKQPRYSGKPGKKGVLLLYMWIVLMYNSIQYQIFCFKYRKKSVYSLERYRVHRLFINSWTNIEILDFANIRSTVIKLCLNLSIQYRPQL